MRDDDASKLATKLAPEREESSLRERRSVIEALRAELETERAARAAAETELERLRPIAEIVGRNAGWTAGAPGLAEVCFRAADWARLTRLLAELDEEDAWPERPSGVHPAIAPGDPPRRR